MYIAGSVFNSIILSKQLHRAAKSETNSKSFPWVGSFRVTWREVSSPGNLKALMRKAGLVDVMISIKGSIFLSQSSIVPASDLFLKVGSSGSCRSLELRK